jgi:anaerobic magnesium-protoporphyrin IX monomethyl ester cyclase
MKVVFACSAFELLGVEYMSAILKQHGHEVKLVYDPGLFDDTFVYLPRLARRFSYQRDTVKKILELEPDLLAFSVVRATSQWALEVATEVKRHLDVPTLFGNIHATSVPEELLANDCVDFVIRGEGEYAMLDLVQSLAKGEFDPEIPNLAFRENGSLRVNPMRPLIADLDTLPFPDKEIFRGAGVPFDYGYLLISERGCPNACTYGFPANYLRRRSPANVVAELKWAKERYGIQVIRMATNNFTSSEEWLEEFADRYAAEKVLVPYWCYVHVRNINERTVRSLVKSNCYQVEFGIQSLDPVVRREILHRSETDEMVENAARLLLRAPSIYVVGDYILGLPKQTVGELDKLCRFYNKNRIGRIHVLWLHTFPDLEITRIATEQGMLDTRPSEEELKEIERKSYLTPDLIFSRVFNQYRTVLILIRYLPPRWIEFILDHRWAMRIMPSIPPIIGSFLVYQFGQEKKFELVRSRLYRRYKHYIGRKLRQWARLRRSTLPPAPGEPCSRWPSGLVERFGWQRRRSSPVLPAAARRAETPGCGAALALGEGRRRRAGSAPPP